MGNEHSQKQDYVFDSLPAYSLDFWEVRQATRIDHVKVSIFQPKVEKQADRKLIQCAAEKYLSCLKTLRHPSIVKFYSSYHSSSGPCLVTEPVKPLQEIVESLHPYEIIAGLYNVLEGLLFLHDKVGMSHNNITSASIFVSPDGSWKLGSLECLTRFGEEIPTIFRDFRNEKGIAPGEKDDLRIKSNENGHAVDVYAFGVLCEELLEFITEPDADVSTFENVISEEILNPNIEAKPKISKIMHSAIFRKDFLEILQFLKNITLKSEGEKRDFFKSLVPRLNALPSEVVAKRLLHLLLSKFVLLNLDAVEHVVPHLLNPQTDNARNSFLAHIFSEDMFRLHVIPVLYNMFYIRDATVRMILLHHFKSFIHLFDRNTLQDDLLPQILRGLKDTNDELVARTLCALGDLSRILGGEVVVGGTRSKYFADAIPKFNDTMSDCPSQTSVNPHDSLSRKPSSSILENKVKPTAAVAAIMNLELKTDSTEMSPEPIIDTDRNGIDIDKWRHEREMERQKRKEELSRRNEERRMKREEKKKVLTKAQGDSYEVSTDEHMVEGNNSDNQVVLKHQSTVTEAADVEDWSDWEEMADDIPTDTPMNAVIQRPITIEPKDDEKLLKTQSKSSSGALQLKKVQKAIPNSIVDDKTSNIALNALDINTKAQHSELPSSTKQSATVHDIKNKTSHKKQSLGAEFDILALDIKTVKPRDELDFFADMAPTIQRKSDGSVLIQEKCMSSVDTMSFVPTESTGDDGWGAGDWDDAF